MFDRTSLTSSEFSWKKALSLATASLLAYQKNQENVIHIAIKSWGFESCETFDVEETQGFVSWDTEVVLISFRGTEGLGDWISNLKLDPENRPYRKVHSGFLRGFHDARNRLETILQRASPNGKSVWVTGHSLGGALATVSGAELLEQLTISGFYTYGQPAMGNGQVRLLYEQNYAGKFYRFVNDDDIAPQVVPGYTHVGQLIWFDGDGNLKRFDAVGPGIEEGMEGPSDAIQPHEMDVDKFLALQQSLLAIKEASGDSAEKFDQSVEGLFPSFSDHSLSRYIKKIRRFADSEPEVHPLIEQAVIAAETESAGVESATRSSLRSKADVPDVPVLLRVKSSKWEAPAGLKIQSRLGSIITARTSINQIAQLSKNKDVISIELSRDGGSSELGSSKGFVHADQVQVPPIDERGDSAIVAVIDTGVDVLHEAFRDDNGQTRIVALWNQKTQSSGRAPVEIDPAKYTQDYGRLYLANEIQQMIDGQQATPIRLRDPFGHGTHVASIAAGRASAPFDGGMAPEAKLVVVIPDMDTDPGDPPSIGYSNSHVDALAFVRATAESLDLPVAVNVSLGMNAGAHDGSSTLEAGFDHFSGIGRDPGFVIIKSAGNERGHKGHAAANAMKGGLKKISWITGSGSRNMDYIEAGYSGFDEIEFKLIDPAGNTSGTVSNANRQESADLGGNFCQLSLTRNHRDNGDNRLVITIHPDPQSIQQGPWTLEMLGSFLPGGGRVDAWVERNSSRAVEFDSGDNDEMTLSIPGTADTIITVAACESKTPLKLTDDSSWGLTRDNRPKPDLCAPGKEIKAARANANSFDVVECTGTSMAAPHVTGAVALLMSKLHKDQTKNQVNAKQLRKALVTTANQFTGRHDKGFGFGALDVLAFMNHF